MGKEWWDEAPLAEDSGDWWRNAPLADAEPKNRTWGEAISETGEKVASGVSAVGEELGNLRDSFFTGVDNIRASANTVATAAQATQLQKSQDKLAELMSYGQGDTPEAQGLRTTIEHYSKRLPKMIGDMTDAQADAQRGAAMTTRPAVAAMGKAKTFGEAWDIFKKNPYDVIAGVTATSLPGTLPALVVGATMGPAAGAAAMGGSSSITEAGSSIADFARDSGVDTTDRKAVEAFFANRENLAAAMSYAGKRAGIIGALDAASGGIAGKTIAPAFKSAIAKQAVNIPSQMAVQAGLGAGGEAGAQIATKGEIDNPGDVLMEAAGELGGAPMEVAAFSKDARSALMDRKPAPAAPAVVEPTLTPEDAPESAPLQIGNTPDPMIGFPDGSVARRSEVEAYIASLPEDQRSAARALMMGLAPQPAKVDPVQSVMATNSVDEAIAAANTAIESDRSAELDSLVQSETRNLQVLRAQIDQNRIKQEQLAQLQTQSLESLGRLPDQQVAAARAATDETPTAMQLAMQRAQSTVNRKISETAPKPAFPFTKNSSGTVLVSGDPVAIRSAFPDARGMVKSVDGKPSGVLFGTSAAPSVLAKLEVQSVQNPAPRTDTEAKAPPAQTPAPAGGEPVAPARVPGAGSADLETNWVDQRLIPVSKRATQKPKGGRNLRSAAYDKNPLMTFLATHGLYHKKGAKDSHKSEFSPDKGIMVMGYGPVFKATGKRLDVLTNDAIEAGYLPKDGTESQLRELVRRAVAGEKISPMYAEGVAEQLAEQSYAEHLAQQHEAAQDEDFDPFQPLTDLEYDLDDAVNAGYDSASDTIKLEVNALLALAEDKGIDTDAIKWKAADDTYNDSEQAYYEAARSALQDAIATGSRDSSANAGSQSTAGSQEGLTSPTRADVLAQQDRAEAAAKEQARADKEAADKAKADAERGEFTLTGSDRAADVGAAGGQTDIFGAAAEPEPIANRFEAGNALTKEQRKAVLATLVDVYKAKGAPRESKGQGRDGHERSGYVHSPELFEKSDITGAMVRYFVTLPDGRIAHPSELFQDYTQNDINNEIERRANAEKRNREIARKTYLTDTFDTKREAADFWNDKSAKSIKTPQGSPSVYDALDRDFITDGSKFALIPSPVLKNQDMMDAIKAEGWSVATPTPEAQPTPEPKPAAEMSVQELLRAAADKMDAVKIDDVGEKIGGARKDTAVSTGAKRKTVAEEDTRPTWAKRFNIEQIDAGFDTSVKGQDVSGKWVIMDSKTRDRTGEPKQVGKYFDSKADAEEALPLIAVAQKHRVSPTGQKNAEGGYTYEIWRDVNDRKRVKVVDQEFQSREDAMRYMAQHATDILETNTTFGEADIPKPENTDRIGVERRTGDVKGEDFRDAFGFRGVEFGLWNNQEERQEVMNAAYDGLMDLADVLNIPPKAIGLNGDLALAFGARGKGLTGARAHYETNRVVMNLTKMNGAGALAHEWLHAFDHYLARQDGKTTAEWKLNKDGTRSLDVNGGEADMASSGFKRVNSGVREELRDAYTKLVRSLFTKAEQYVEDTARADKFVSVSRGELENDLANLRKELSEQKDVRYYKRNNKPASAEQLAEFDALAAELVEGRGLSTEWKSMPGKNRLSIQTRHTNETLEKLNEIYKTVRGRSGFNAERRGVLDALTGYMRRYDQRLQMLREANSLTTKTKQVPTSFAMDAKSLDQGRGGDYWTSPHEMLARAFQGYVEDAIAEKEGRSPFLNYAPENAGILTPWGAKRPFPAGEERKAMNGEFSKFISAIKTKETDTGVAMFSRGTNEPVTKSNDVVGNQGGRSADDISPGGREIPRTGEPITLYYNRNTESSKGMAPAGMDFGQKIEPVGEYMNVEQSTKLTRPTEKWESGRITFKNPLVLEHKSTDSNGWKRDLSEMFGGKTGSKLTAAIKKAGYDAIITHDKYGLSETVNLGGVKNESTAPDSGGAPVAQTDTPEFRKWFGDSKVVDADGKPLVVYHGTNKDQQGEAFTMLDAYASNYGLFGQGAYLTADPSVASEYTSKGRGESPSVYPLYASIKNPIDMDAKADPQKWIDAYPEFDVEAYHEGGTTNESYYRAVEDALRDEGVEKWEGAEAMQDGLRRMGHDGITHIGGGRVKSEGKKHRVFIAFDPEQIKSATGNNGQFDASNPDIRFARNPFGTPTTVTALQSAIKELTGLDGMNKLGRIVATTASEIKSTWEPLLGKSVNIESEGDAGAAQGFFDPKSKTIFLIADHIRKGAETAVLAHELMHKHGQSVLGKEGWDRLHGVISSWERADHDSNEWAVYNYARNKVEAVGAELSNQELFPYAVEAALKMGIKPDMQAGRGTVARWLESVRQNLKVVWSKITGKPETFKAQDMVNLAFGIAQMENPEYSSLADFRGTNEPVTKSNDVVGNQGGRSADDTTPGDLLRKLEGTQVVDSNGSPLLVYHGSKIQIDRFDTSKTVDGGLHFGSKSQASMRSSKNLMSAYLNAKSLRRSKDMGGNWKSKISSAKSSGHDGIVYLNRYEGISIETVLRADAEKVNLDALSDAQFKKFAPESQDSYIVFYAKQVIQPNESTAPDSGGAMFSRSGIVGQTSPHSWDAPEASKFDDLVYKLQDKQIDTKRVVEEIRKTGKALADEKDVYLQEELFHGRAAARTEDFVNNELSPLITEMKMRGIDIAALDEYLHARHAEEANELIADRNPEIKDGGSGMTTKAARDYLGKLPAAERQRLEAVAAKVDAILGKTRQMYADYDLESQSTVNGWGKMFKHYVPLMREDKDGGMGIGQGFSIKGKETKGRTGSTRKVVDILANIAMQRERAIVRGEKNRVATALVGLAELNPNEDFWAVGPPPTEKVYDPKSNSVVERADPLFKSRENVVVAKVKEPSGEVVEKAVRFNEDNERAVRMAVALKNLDAAQLNGLLGVSAKISRYFAAINTQWNPIFGTVNLVRDFQGAILNLSTTALKNHKAEIAGHTLAALKGVYLDARAAREGKPQTSAWAKLWEDFQNEGGQTGYRDMFANSNDRAKAIESELSPTKWMDSTLGKIFTANGNLKVPMEIAQKKAAGLFGWLSDYNLAMENAVRLSAYKVGLEQGMSKQQAASLAKNLTVNFNRKGQVGQQAGAVYAFFNASMQGTARLGQTLFDMDGSDTKTIRLSATGKKIVYGGVMLGVMQALLLAAAGFDDEEPPDFVRERSLIIPTGGKSYITIPMPLGLHVLPNMGRIPTEFVLGGFKQPVKSVVKLLGLMAGAFNPIGGGASLTQMLAPTAVDPLVALAENKDWTGKPIAKTSYNKATPGHALTKDTASAPSKVLAEAINLMTGGTKYTAGVFSPTPDQIDYLWGQVTGGVGRELSKAQQAASAVVTGEDLPMHKIPLVGRFYGDADTQSAQSSKFYATINRLNEHEAEIKGLRKDRKSAELAEYMRDNPEARMFETANKVELDVQKMRRMKRELMALNAPPERIKALEERITLTMTRFNERAAAFKKREAAVAHQ